MGNNILRCFFSQPERELTIKEVEKKSGLTYKPVYFGLQELLKKGYLLHRREKWKHYFKLNLSSDLVRKELELAEIEKREEIYGLLTENQKRAIAQLVEKAQDEVPLLCVRLLDWKDSLKLFFVVSELNENSERIKGLCQKIAEDRRVKMVTVTSSMKVFHHLLLKKSNLSQLAEDGVTIFGTEFYIREKSRALEGR